MTITLSPDLVNGKAHCQSCGRIITPYDQFIKGVIGNFQDIPLCEDCFIAAVKDIAEYEKEREKWLERRRRRRQ
jgi:hypothetical protein